jgi:CelD/BcsL family acetyltransferase involved in cellulose biosynthesis
VLVSVENAFNFLSPEYWELFRSSIATAFQHPIWLARFYAGLVESGNAEPLIVVVRKDGQLLMVLPLIRRRYGFLRVIEAADLGVSDYASPAVGTTDIDRILGDTSVRGAIGKAIKPYDLVRIGKLPKSALAMAAMLGVDEPRAMGTNAYAVPLTASYPAWREANLPRSYRKELDKKSRQLGRRGAVTFECVTDPAGIEAAFKALRHYRGLRFGDDGELLQLDRYYRFYLDLALSRDAVARTYVMHVDQHIAAVVFALSIEGRVLVILSGFDHEQFKNQSIGALMFEQVARDCIERSDVWLDFTIGDEPYKLTFGAKPEPMWIAVRSHGPLGFLAQVLIERIPHLRAILRKWLHARSAGVSEGSPDRVQPGES